MPQVLAASRPTTRAGYRDNATEADRDKWSQYWQRKNEAVESYPVDLVSYCSGDCPMYILAVRGTEMTANRGYTVTVDPASLVVPEEKVAAALRAFCERYEIEFKEPKWLLCSMWN